MTDPFRCICLLPLSWPCDAALACQRAGALPLIDVSGPLEPHATRLHQLRRELPEGAELGLSLPLERIALAQRLTGVTHLVLTDWTPHHLDAALVDLAAPQRTLWLELRDSDAMAEVADRPFHGWVARGVECGGHADRESVFMLCQHLARQPKPFWVQGALGPHAAAAARVGGASGVVLSDNQAQTAARSNRTLGRRIRRVIEVAESNPATAALHRPLAPQAPLARAMGTALPVIQGPMSRVSDELPFAVSVAKAGALPVLALGMMSGEQIAERLQETQRALPESAWGVGLLGYLDDALQHEQFLAVARARPPVAILAGGRADQVARLEAAGIATYLHVPTPELLRLAWEQGVRRFIFEGSECGGHVGPMTSFPLWESMTEALLALRPPAGAPAEVVLAGGIHDARSAAMAVTLAAPLLEQGVRLGVLMGTAYLFTHEAVQRGAIVPGFQRQALSCRHTVVIETRPGHRIRCAPNAFVSDFAARKAALVQEGLAPEQVADRLETLIAGKLRLAAKGMERTPAGLVSVDEDQQARQGLFMMGELAGLQSVLRSCAELHRAVTEDATAWLQPYMRAEPAESLPPPAPPIAIIGIGCLLPGAQDPATLWRNLLDGRSAIREVPAARWDWRMYFDADPQARDRCYSKWGSFLDPFPFDPLAFGIPPKALGAISLAQLVALETTRRALHDAGLEDLSSAAALRKRTAVIFATSSTGDLDQAYKVRTGAPLASHLEDDFWRRLPEWSEESYPGILLNIVAGRIANRFDLGGVNYTVDAACASSLAALDLAVRELQSNRCDLALAGAVETEMTPHTYIAFSKTRAMSPTGQARVFDDSADGIVLGEGAVTLVLKRLDDAERAGDRIYALIRGVAGASDGRGLGLTAPNAAGQMRAVQHAQRAAAVPLSSLGLYEAHGTGTRVGDRTELESYTNALRQAGAGEQSCATGSVKSLLGHTRCTAGLTGLLKATLALHHRVLPPHWGVRQPLPALAESGNPLYLLDRAQPWLNPDQPCRAGVSAFGFGGSNFHAILEAHQSRGPWGAAHWPAELFALAAPDRARLGLAIERLERALDGLERGWALADLALASALEAERGGPVRLALVASDGDTLRALLQQSRAALAEDAALPADVYWALEPQSGDLAWVFPGQGAQYPGMAAELALYCGELRAAIQDSGWQRIIWPPASFDEQTSLAQRQALTATEVAQPAIAAFSAGLLDLAHGLGLRPDRVAGHSFGEFVALHAAGVVTRADLYRIAAARGQIMAGLGQDQGAMAAVAMGAESLRPFLAAFPTVSLANLNSPQQTVLSGPAPALEALLASLSEAGYAGHRLPVAAAFHSPLVAAARQPFADFLRQQVQFQPGKKPVHANLDGEAYPSEADAILQRCVEHLEQPVDFIAQVEAMWRDGVRCFLELGPGHILTRLIGQILGDRPHLALAADGGLAAWLRVVARLWVLGRPMDLVALFDGRDLNPISLDAPPSAIPPGWMLDGGRVYVGGESPASARIGELPLLNAESPPTPSNHAEPWAVAFADYQRSMRQFLDQQERQLTQLWERQRAPGAAPTPPPATEPEVSPPAVRSPPQQAAVDRERLLEQLVRMVSERTGYPQDMLNPDHDLEGELGVDSIKRIEIIGTLVKGLVPEAAHKLQSVFNQLVRAKTLRALVDQVVEEAASVVIAPAIQLAAKALEACPRHVMKSDATPLPQVMGSPASGFYLVTADQGEIGHLVLTELLRRGARASLLTRDDLENPDRMLHRVAVLREVHGPVRAILHLAALGLAPRPATHNEWRQATWLAVKSLFMLLQGCLEELRHETAPPCMVVATEFGGDWGRRQRGSGCPAAAGGHGLLRCLEQEYPQLFAKVVDFDPSLASEQIAACLVNELLVPGGGEEVGYRQGQRSLFSPTPAPLTKEAPAHDWRPRAGDVILATGGARGITAEILHELATPGVRLILVGRTSGTSSNGDAEREATLAALRAAGAEVEYHGVDVRSETAFGALIDDLYRRFGTIHGVLHGAGIIDDRRFADKSLDSFERVFDTKADSGTILARQLRPEGLKWVVFFASVSGRFGNSGQADYAAGNEVLVQLAQQLDAQWPDTRVVAIAWGPWQGTGMASQGVQAQLEAQGILPIQPEAGRGFFVDELSWGTKGESEIIAGHGPWGLSIDQTLRSVFDMSMRLLHLDASG